MSDFPQEAASLQDNDIHRLLNFHNSLIRNGFLLQVVDMNMFPRLPLLFGTACSCYLRLPAIGYTCALGVGLA